jgi:Ca-activated chloride channel family protein
VSFNAPSRLWLLLVVVALLAGYVLMQGRRRHAVVRFTNVDLLASVAPARPGWRRHVPAAALLLALTVMVFGFARPTRKVDVARNGATIVLAIDVSDSMKATDVAPNRITVAQRAAKEFVAGLPKQFRLSVIAFSGSANVLIAPTTDHEEALRRLDHLQLAPNTAIGEAIFVALDQISSTARTPANKPPAARIVLLSDGNTTVGRSTEEAAATAADVRVPVSTIAYGTDRGTVVADGRVLRVPVDRDALRATAETTGGTYFEAATGSELKQVYKDIGTEIDLVARRQELTPWFAAMALGVALAAAAMGLMWAPRLP